ncbi:MAG: S1/P1 nuclease [Candidatus Eremiobacteraeota bacterium]|nr:S1/P1 nuclease [Candidatus Eremiobacteraeota bacterium]
MNAAGHQLFARVAWDGLNEKARKAVQSLVQNPNNPTVGAPTSARDNDVFTYTTYMDNIRPQLSDKHFVNIPLEGSGTLPPGENSVTFQKSLTDRLADPKASADQKAEALRLAGHLAGDIANPLHNADRGDRGGNSLKLNGKESLHSYWDSGGGQWKNDATPSQFADQAVSIMRSYPRKVYNQRQLEEFDSSKWSREGWQLAKTDVYPGVTAGTKPNPKYADNTRKTMDSQIALAGYRWANQLNLVFGAGNPTSK